MTDIQRPGMRIFGAPTRPRKGQQQDGHDMSDEHQGGDVRAAMKRVDEATEAYRDMDQEQAGTQTEVDATNSQPEVVGPVKIAAKDPAPTTTAVAQERALQIVDNISTGANAELRSLRDQIDGLMKDVHDRRELIKEAIRAHGEYAETVISVKSIIEEHVVKMRRDFDSSQTMLPPTRKV